MVRFSGFADEVTDDFLGQIEFLVLENIRNMEIRFVNRKNVMDLTAAELIETKKILSSNEIGISAIGSPIGKVKINEPFQPHLDKFNHAIELAQFFNAPFIRVFSYYAPEGESIEDYREEVIKRKHKSRNA